MVQTERIWSQTYPTQPYNLNQSDHSAFRRCMVPEKNIEYDTVAAVKRQSLFFEKVMQGRFFFMT